MSMKIKSMSDKSLYIILFFFLNYIERSMSTNSSTIANLLQQGRLHHNANRLSQAEQCYFKILNTDPSHSEALHLLGLIAHQSGQHAQAINYLQLAVKQQPNNYHYLNNLGEAYRISGDFNQAEDYYNQSLNIKHSHAEAHYNLASLYLQQDKPELSEHHWRQALVFRPDYIHAHLQLGMLLLNRNQIKQSYGHLHCASALQPENIDAQLYLAKLHQRNHDFSNSLACYNKVLSRSPNHLIALLNRSSVYKHLGNLDQAIEGFRMCIALKPDFALAHLNLGIALKDQDNTQEALASFKSAIQFNPQLYKARLGICISQIPALYDSAEQIEIARKNYSNELDALIQNTHLEDASQINTVSLAVGGLQPFYLPYQGKIDLQLQSRYGQLIHKIQATRFPEYALPINQYPLQTGERIRVGILSGFFNNHSNWKIPIKGWCENIDHSQFELFAYHVGQSQDQQTKIAKNSFDHFLSDTRTTEQWASVISSHKLHVLIIPETGMDPITLTLAALRLAPVQCTSWGHPQTSGLPTIDYFLSSDLMEPEDAEQHYSEKLVRLPNLSIYYSPVNIEAANLTRSDMGLREKATLYFCAQSLFKYLPQHDEIFVEIAKQVPEAQFVFLAYAPSMDLTERFHQRLLKAFNAHGMNGEAFICILPKLNTAHFHALNSLADVFLDSIGWSGCNSTLEAIAHDLPIVSYAGKLMRGRHTFAILRMLGLESYENFSLQDYINQAVRMSRDTGYKEGMSQLIKERKHRLYYDSKPVLALQKFIKDLVINKQSEHNR